MEVILFFMFLFLLSLPLLSCFFIESFVELVAEVQSDVFDGKTSEKCFEFVEEFTFHPRR